MTDATPLSGLFYPFLVLWCLWSSWIFMHGTIYRSKQ